MIITKYLSGKESIIKTLDSVCSVVGIQILIIGLIIISICFFAVPPLTFKWGKNSFIEAVVLDTLILSLIEFCLVGILPQDVPIIAMVIEAVIMSIIYCLIVRLIMKKEK